MTDSRPACLANYRSELMPSPKRERQREGRQERLAAAMAEQRRRQRIKTVRNVVIAFVVIIGIIFVLSRGGDDNKPVTTASGSSESSSSTATSPVFTYGTGPCPNPDGSSPQTLQFAAAPQQCIDPAKTYTATFDTTAGSITVQLDTSTTPGTVNNFVTLARYHYYDATQIFRFAQSIGIVQGGAPHTNAVDDPGPGYSLPDEGYNYLALDAGLNGAQGGPYSYAPGDLVMARKAQPNGAGAQYFFVVNDNAKSLDNDGTYVKFGTVTQGLDVLQNILAMGANDQPPTPPVVVNSVTISET
jgi:cyclophilin family peptidyl-prolyl cis-trans isomerase